MCKFEYVTIMTIWEEVRESKSFSRQYCHFIVTFVMQICDL